MSSGQHVISKPAWEITCQRGLADKPPGLVAHRGAHPSSSLLCYVKYKLADENNSRSSIRPIWMGSANRSSYLDGVCIVMHAQHSAYLDGVGQTFVLFGWGLVVIIRR